MAVAFIMACASATCGSPRRPSSASRRAASSRSPSRSACPDACVYHVNGALGDGYTVLDYWSSKAARDEFMQSRVGPSVAALGIDAEPVIEELTVHNSLTQEATAGV